jgi:hypothetical protein
MLNDKMADNQNGFCSKIQPSKIEKFGERDNWEKKFFSKNNLGLFVLGLLFQ